MVNVPPFQSNTWHNKLLNVTWFHFLDSRFLLFQSNTWHNKLLNL